ncbi:hypothetical protein DAMA08_021850 [Martiniozyma asiatica (nom. inval.)]|nr:hypothetical protein DAMA08_021850 [Martiniozyma asiatica]
MKLTVSEPAQLPGGDLLEGITYDDRNKTLYYINIVNGSIHVIPHDSAPFEIKVDKSIGVIGLTTTPGVLIAGVHTKLVTVDVATGKITELLAYPDGNVVDGYQLRSNDGSVSPDGAFWVGTMVDGSGSPSIGSLYRYTHLDGLVKQWGGSAIANGINWDLKRGKMYWTDSATHCVFSYDWDVIENKVDAASKKVFYRDDLGFEPDGSCLDTEGNLYVAVYGRGQVRRVNPQGFVDLEIDLPNKYVTCCVFGGDDYSDLYITTAKNGQEGGLGGRIFIANLKAVGARGKGKNIFKLQAEV